MKQVLSVHSQTVQFVEQIYFGPPVSLASHVGEGLKLAFDEPPPSDDELSRMEAAAEAKRRAIEEDEEDDDNTDEKTKVKVDCREYEDNEIVYL